MSDSKDTHNKPATGMRAAFSSEEFTVKDALGGPRGFAESAGPTLAFVILYLVTKDVVLSCAASLAVVAVALVVRLVQREQITPVISGAVGVALGAFMAVRSGHGSDFYVPGLWINLGCALGFAFSALAGRPAIGYIAASMDAKVSTWEKEPFARKVYSRATWLFAAFFALKVAVQAPLYFVGATNALGIVKLVMGIPAFVVVTYVTFLMHKRVVSRFAVEERN